jgi:hypothetical protein
MLDAKRRSISAHFAAYADVYFTAAVDKLLSAAQDYTRKLNREDSA